MTSPDAIILPGSTTRFAATAARLAALAPGHSMADWLSFMARVASAQQLAVAAVSIIEGPAPSAVDRAIDAGMPPLAVDGHRRDPAWRAALSHILDAIEVSTLPPQARDVTVRIRAEGAASIEALADQFLHGEVEDVAAALYIASAVQVYFTALAAKLPADKLRLLSQRGLCPCCGSTPSAGLIAATGKTPGARYLYCSLCSTAWNYVRAACITCGDASTIALQGIEGDVGVVKAETCDKCRTYAKMIYQKQDMRGDPYADDLASFGLDILVAEAGWSRHAPNPLLLVARPTS
ncbi:formate dehydrogenase accessory protein FdhE [Bradyrhizobium pachyrhizi]|uniref:formate dehydrogenase accessory protein FdhE n=1 Tax=Bradyrhizobium pachyrhizi TaxID=280333 RepID=UPI003221421C